MILVFFARVLAELSDASTTVENIPIIETTTKSSIKVKALFFLLIDLIHS
jgi:hypothetical protein